MVAIYLTESSIQILQGSYRGGITKSSPVKSLSGCMAQGKVTDPERFCTEVQELFRAGGFSGKNVKLVLRTGAVIIRVMKAPFRSDAGVQQFIANEMAYVDRTENPIYGYYRISEGNSRNPQRVLALVIDRGIVQTYLELFTKCGVQIASVHPAIVGALELLRGCTALRQNDAILQVIEESGYTDFLFCSGEYNYSDNAVSAYPAGSQERGYDMARAIRNLVQFTKSQGIRNKVDRVYLLGSDAQDRKIIAEAVAALHPELKTEELQLFRSELANRAAAVCAAGAMSGSRAAKTSDFLFRLRQVSKARKSMSFLGKSVIAAVILTVVLSGISAELITWKNSLQAQLGTLQAFNTSSEVQQKLAQYEELYNNRVDWQNRSNALDSAQKSLDTYPLPNSTVNQMLENCAAGLASVSISQYDSATGTLTVSVTASQVDRINQFIEKLRQQSIFDVQEYSGYQKLSDDSWAVNVTLGLKSSAGR